MKAQLIALALATALVLPAHAGDDVQWTSDFDAAAAIAKRDGKDLLVDFTGSDWCPYCIQLVKEVFSHAEFQGKVTEQYVLVALDFERNGTPKAGQANPARNSELVKEYGITSFPTVLLMSPDGEAYGQTGYVRGGPTVYLEHLAALREKGMQGVALLRAFEAAPDDAAKRAELERIVEFLAAVDMEEVASAKRLLDPLRSALQLDPENASGLKLRALKALLRSGAGNENEAALARELDPKNEAGAFELAVFAELQAVTAFEHLDPVCVKALALLETGVVHDEELALNVFANCARWSDEHLNDPERAKRFAARALDFEIKDDAMAAKLNAILDAK